MFQSSPSPGAGRCIGFPPIARPVKRVSILAQPGGRALLAAANSPCFNQSCFNPRPARGPGAARERLIPAAIAFSRFNPRPARGPGAALWQAHQVRSLTQFQSSPSPGAGRCIQSHAGVKLHTPFVVSILAQPGGRALPTTPLKSKCSCVVSILAQPGGRALHLTLNQSHSNQISCFNPRPARGPGAAPCTPIETE